MLPVIAEMMMARRRIGQERLGIAQTPVPGSASLDQISGLIDWQEIDWLLAGVYAAAKGEAAWPRLALFRALMLAISLGTVVG